MAATVKKKTGTPAATLFTDSLVNLLTGLGVPGKSKSAGAFFAEVELSWDQMEAAYGNDWLSGKVCDVHPFDMTREWRTFTGSLEEDVLQRLMEEEKRLHLVSKFREALTWARVYGGCGIVINVDDGTTDSAEPLNMDGIRKDGLRWVNLVDARYLMPYSYDYDPFSPNYGYPELYTVSPSSLRVHHSRILRFEGFPLPLNARRKNRYWGKSAIVRLYNALKNAAAAQDNIGELIYEATVDVVKVPGLQDMVTDPESEAALTKRWGVAKLMKSINKMLLIDENETYESHQQSFQGVNGLMQQFLNVVAGAADIPITRLLGQSPGGLNSTGDSDLNNYYDSLKGQQVAKMGNQLDTIDEIMYRSITGKAPEFGELAYKFNPLWQVTDLDKSTIEKNNADRDKIYYDMNVVNEKVIASQLALNDTYTAIDTEYIDKFDDFEGLDEMDDDLDEEQLAALTGDITKRGSEEEDEEETED